MTKLRRPLSEHEAVKDVIDFLGLADAARCTDRHARTVSSWSDQQRAARSGTISLRAALLLDRECIARGGAIPPIGSFYMAELRATCTNSFYAAAARAELAARAAIEAGQASAACLLAYSGPPTVGGLLSAEREIEEAIVAFGGALFDVRRQLSAAGLERDW